MMRNVNVADEAKGMSDAELAATIATFKGEQARRAYKKLTDSEIAESLDALQKEQERRADPEIARMLQDRHAELYGPTE